MDIIVAAVVIFAIIVGVAVIAPTVKMALDLAPYLYANTRCAARTGLLLDRRKYDGLLAAGYEKELYGLLEDTGYSVVVEKGQSFDIVSPLLEQELHDTYTWLARISPEKLQPIIRAMLQRFEVAQLKETFSRVSNGLPIGGLHHIQDPSFKLKLEGATDKASFLAAVEGTPYAEALADENPSTALDSLYLRNVRNVIQDIPDKDGATAFLDYWRRVIDLANVRMVLRSAGNRVSGGMVTLDQGMDVSQLIEALQPVYGQLPSDPVELERTLQASLHKASQGIATRHPLKGGPLVKYLIMKELEMRNLNIILKLKGENFTTEQISPLVVV